MWLFSFHEPHITKGARQSLMRTKHIVFTILFAVLATATLLSVSGFRIQDFTGQFNKLIAKDTARFGTTDHGAMTVYPIASLASAATLTVPGGSIFSLTGTANITRIIAGTSGQKVTFICASTETLTDGVNLKLASTLAGTADDAITLVAQDTFWVELCRSVN